MARCLIFVCPYVLSFALGTFFFFLTSQSTFSVYFSLTLSRGLLFKCGYSIGAISCCFHHFHLFYEASWHDFKQAKNSKYSKKPGLWSLFTSPLIPTPQPCKKQLLDFWPWLDAECFFNLSSSSSILHVLNSKS